MAEEHKKIKDKFIKASSGKRFRRLHRYMNKHLNRSRFMKIILFIIGTIFLIIGFILLFIPGPGSLFLVVGLSIIAAIWYSLAKYLDKVELLGKKLYEKIRAKIKQRKK